NLFRLRGGLCFFRYRCRPWVELRAEATHCSVGGECLDEPSHSVRRFPFAARRGGSGVPGAGKTSVCSRSDDGVTKRVISVAEDVLVVGFLRLFILRSSGFSPPGETI